MSPWLVHTRSLPHHRLRGLTSSYPARLAPRPTEAVVKDAFQLLDYVATYPNATVVFRPSDTRLGGRSDASWLSESESRSRAAALFFLLREDELSNPDTINGCIDCFSTIIKSMVGSAFEAEYAAFYLAGQTAKDFRNILADLGHPQGQHPFSATTQAPLASKAIDMRYHRIRERVDQGHFTITRR